MKNYIKPISENVIVCMNALMGSAGGEEKQNEPSPAPARKLYV